MADQVQVAKLTQGVLIAPKADNVAISKIVMTALLVPSSSGGGSGTSTGQGRVRTRIVVR